MLSGEIPKELGNCSELINMFLYDNGLSGTLPRELGTIPMSFGNLSNLQELMLSSNNITGSIPSVLSNCTRLVQLQIDANQISGLIPPEIGLLKELNIFLGWQNKLEGNIPTELAGCQNLQALDLSQNLLTGALPPGLFQLRNLTKLLLISNSISGVIPPEIGSCTSLVRLRLVNNKITGEIPREIGLLQNLSFLDLSENSLSGPVPWEISNCLQLQMLNLSNNTLRGSLPLSLSSLTKLQVLDVSSNDLTGKLPDSLGQLLSLNRLILSKNSFNGEIPPSLGHCMNLQLLDLSSNNISGGIPEELFDIQDLDIALNLSWNSLDGSIPARISALNRLSVLDISHNMLSGDLFALSGLENLVSLNISHNRFSGYLPDSKVFRQLVAEEMEGNSGLCSKGIRSCFVSNSTLLNTQHGGDFAHSQRLKIAIGLLISVTAVLAVLGVLAVLRARQMIQEGNDSEKGENLWTWQFTPFQKLSFTVEHVLKCLVEGNVIGKGCSGVVYRAEMPNQEVIAVKKLWPVTVTVAKTSGGRDSFSAEVKTLGSIRHKNIVRFLGCCWNKNTRLLMYDYMSNGSLGSLLHARSGECSLGWEVRYKIILGAAQGLAYLHHDCVPPIVHRDIKANNILIGPDFEPYIGDFGLAKLVDDGDFARSSKTIAGSYGYIAPEYGYSMKITEKSDVYSYGVVVLEVLTGKEPIDPTIPDGLHIVDWVKKIRDIQVIDQGLQARPESEVEEVMQTLGVALLCVNPIPEDRPTMKDVAAMLSEIRQEREEPMKGGGNNGCSGSCNNNGEGRDESLSSSTMQQTAKYLRSSSTSFSASSLLYSSSSSTSNARPNLK
ncbi:BnaCnng30900D [Brassica napus]|uniref:non-specific serine/threonine protein kinase n=1 Tax=Brassica napus TaxID=3708 RepID=A0A078J0N2_BRANA|nr:BnaCnng30900D [Brassica napus]